MPDFDALTEGPPIGGGGSAGNGGSGGSIGDVGGSGGTPSETGGSGGDGGSSGMGGSGGTVDAGEPVEGNLFINGDFESGPTGWAQVGNCLVQTVTTTARSGSSSLFTSNRTQTWEGPGHTLLNITPGQSYRVTVWARSETGSFNLNLTYKKRCTDDDPAGVFTSVGSRFVSDTWSEVSGILVAPECEQSLVESILYVEASITGPASNFFIDDTSLVPQTL